MSSNLLIKTARSSHRFCFICGNKHIRLHQLKRESMVHAYLKHKLLIKVIQTTNEEDFNTTKEDTSTLLKKR